MKGFLEKKRTGLKVGPSNPWQKRWFALRGDVLCYYRQKPDAKKGDGEGGGTSSRHQPSGAIPLANVSVFFGKKDNIIRIETMDGSSLPLLKTEGSTTGLIGNSYELRAENITSAQSWMQALHQASLNHRRINTFPDCPPTTN